MSVTLCPLVSTENFNLYSFMIETIGQKGTENGGLGS